jgi:hypothetical protein
MLDHDKYPQVIMGVLVEVENGDELFWILGVGRGGGGGFLFSSSSQGVPQFPNNFPKNFPIAIYFQNK